MSVTGSPPQARLKDWVTQLCDSSLDLKKICSTIARCLRASGKPDWESLLSAPLAPRELLAARNLVYQSFMDKPRLLLEKGDLRNLGAWKSGGIVYVRGRFSPLTMLKVVCTDRLPLVHGSSRLGYLLAWETHMENHDRDVNIMLAKL